MQVKITVIYHYPPIRMTKIQNTDNTACWQGREMTEILVHSILVGMQNGVATVQDGLEVSYETKHMLTI